MGETATAAATRTLDVARIRAEFPALHQESHGKPLVYLDNAATTQKPRRVIDAVTRFYERDCANVHRGVHQLSQRATIAYESARTTVKRHLGAADSREIVFTRGTTEAINLVASSFVRPRLAPGDEILITGMEHHSNIVPWQLLCEATGAVLKIVPITDAGEIELERFAELLSERTRMVGVVHVSNALGTVNPVREMVEIAHDRGVPVLVDGAQAVPHGRVDVGELDCDFYVFSGHKTYGPTGIGALYGKREHLLGMVPWQGGGDMILSVTWEKTRYAEPPHRFEAGTPNIAGAIGLAAALDYLDGLGPEAVAAHEAALLEAATEAVLSVPGVRLIGAARHRAGALSFVMDGIHPHDIGTILDTEGVAIRAGHHCAQPVMQRFGVSATVRASFAVYNTHEEIGRLVEGLYAVKEVFG
ncbi:MAG: SufS family cysteine desulfurase [Thermoanaerobaculales bacterium]|jgi:cysteine desulfurase/selenocysteine lyase|nr:SufS family cysteine desulfurase [Thermoanaerobaculales bacterium]